MYFVYVGRGSFADSGQAPQTEGPLQGGTDLGRQASLTGRDTAGYGD